MVALVSGGMTGFSSGCKFASEPSVPFAWGVVVTADLARTVVRRARGDVAVVGEIGSTEGDIVEVGRRHIVDRSIERTRGRPAQLRCVQRVVEHLGRIREGRKQSKSR